MEYVPMETEDLTALAGNALFITNEGNFNGDNASLSVYYPGVKRVENEIFSRKNGYKLGDVAQSMTIYDGKGYVVVNNSGVVYVVDVNNFQLIGGIKGLVSPRYIHFVSDTKAYITDLYASRITIFNPQTLQKIGVIQTPGHKSTEQMVQYGKYVFTNCWSYDNKLLIIDSERDEVVDSIALDIQPTSLVLDRYNKIWTVTDGGVNGKVHGEEAPSLYRIDAATRQVERKFTFQKGDWPSEVTLNGTRDTLYYLNKDVWRLAVTTDEIPTIPFLKYSGTRYYGLAVDPVTSEVYVGDAIDYQQPGVVYRLRANALPVDTFNVGIIPGAFCFRPH
ncbi:MAG: YncE family protein [Odoribacter sp.]